MPPSEPSLRAHRSLYKPPKRAGGTLPLTRGLAWLLAALIGAVYGVLVGLGI